MQKAVIIGNYGVGNLGDEAILESILSVHSGYDFTVFSHTPFQTKQRHQVSSVYPLPFGLRSLLRGKFKKSFTVLHHSDLVILGGGGLFTDEKLRAVLLWGWHFWWAKFFKKPVILYANSVGPLSTKWGRFIVRRIFQKADLITVRDKLSANLLKSMQIKKFKLTADPVFLLEKIEEKKSKRHKRVAISLRPWVAYQEKTVSVLRELVVDLEQKGYQILLIPMQSVQDDDTKILSQIASEQTLLVHPDSFTEVVELLRTCTFAIGMRLHFLIAAALAQTPFLTLSYSQKTTALAEALGQKKYLLPLEKLDFKKIQALLSEFEADAQEIGEMLVKKVAAQKELARKNREVLKECELKSH